MIAATELRIGNFVQLKDPLPTWGHSIVWELKKGAIYIGDERKIHSTLKEYGVIGIPITEKWLIRFGIDFLSETKDGTVIYWKKSQRINVDKQGNFWYKRYNGTISINYVHQLQNLYFALEGEELKLIV